MHKVRNPFSQTLPGFIGITLVLAACSPVLPLPSRPTAATGLEIAPVLRPYYQDLGGEQTLGSAISTVFVLNGADCQYTVNALMCHDPEGADPDGYFLAPLGRQLQPVDPPAEFPPDPSRVVLDGYSVDEDILSLYQELGGEENCGQPISQVQVITDAGRIQQHFENVGFYRSIADPQGKTRLLPYGAQSCGNNCAASAQNIRPDVIINTPFEKSLAQISGTAAIFGEPLTEPYLAGDSNLEQVYSAILVTAPLDHPEDIDLKPLPVMLGMPAAAPSEQVYGLEQNMVFYPVAGSLGYHIPVFFNDFINRHGGMELAGRPLAEPLTVYAENLARQCFENYCLDYHLEKEADQAVSLTNLGQQYLEKINLEEISPYTFPKDAYILQVGESRPRISSEETQVIHVFVINENGNQPAAGLEVHITVTLPDDSQAEYLTPPTDQNGFTSVEISPLPGAESSSLVSYQACLNIPSDTPVCAADAYMIWNIP